jgi:Tol biopolymer transport system component
LENSGTFSPDGKWLAFISDAAGQPEVYLQAFEAGKTPRLRGERRRISRRGALNLRWRGDGKELFYAGADGKMYVVPITLGETPQIGSPAALFDIEIEATTPIITAFTFDVSPDGQRFLLPRLTNPERNHLVVVQNWQALLR